MTSREKITVSYLGRSIVLVAFTLFFGISARGQISISGTIRESETGKQLPGANLTIDGSFLSSFSDGEGHYLIRIPRSIQLTLHVSYMGYQTLKKDLHPTHDTIVNFEMIPNVLLGEETNIVATRVQPKTPATYSTISAKEIRETNLGKDITYILQSTPSVVVTSDGGTGIGYTGINIRGSDLTRINVTLNGIPINDAETQGVWFVDLPDLASSTDNVQIQRGVGTSTNGPGAFGATINIQTTGISQDPYAELDVSGGSYNTLKGTFRFGTGMIKNKFAFDGRASYITSDGYIDRAWSRLKSFYISGGYFGNRTTLKFNVLSGTEKTYQAWDGVPKDSLGTNRTYNPSGEYVDQSGNIAYYDNQTDNYQQDYYQALFSQEIGRYININAAFNYTKGYGYYESYAPGQSFSSYGLADPVLGNDTIFSTDLVNRKFLDNNYYCATFSANYQKKEKLKLRIGGAWSQYYGDHYGKIIWARFASNGDNERNWYSSTGLKKDFNLFAKLNYTFLDRIHFYADMQYRYVYYDLEGTLDDLNPISQLHRFDFFNPKAGIFVDITTQQSAYLSFGIANREPSRNNYESADADHMPTSEQLMDWELGYDLKLSHFNAGINFYYMNYNDQLVLTGQINNVGEAIMTNVPKSYRTGIEINAGAIITKWLIWNFTSTLSKNRIGSFTEYVDAYDSNYNFTGQKVFDLGETTLSFSPSVLFTNSFTFKPVRNSYITLTSKYVGNQYIDNTSSSARMLQSYFVNGITAGYSLKTKALREIGFNLAINNIFSAKYESNAWVYSYYVNNSRLEENGYFPQALINVLFGITFKI
jgi:iron complex outermembrane recepter protein